MSWPWLSSFLAPQASTPQCSCQVYLSGAQPLTRPVPHSLSDHKWFHLAFRGPPVIKGRPACLCMSPLFPVFHVPARLWPDGTPGSAPGSAPGSGCSRGSGWLSLPPCGGYATLKAQLQCASSQTMDLLFPASEPHALSLSFPGDAQPV